MKNIVIIGASRGIGREIGRILSNNHNVLLLSRNISKLRVFQKELPKIKIGEIDLQSKTLRTDLESIVSAEFKQVDILINNAGYLVNKPVLELTDEDIEDSFNTNVFGLIKSCQTLIPYMKAGSHIVNIGSMGGYQGSSKFPGLSIYSASKSAVAGFSECLAEELGEENIQVNCLALGAAQTEMLEEAFPGYEAPVSAKEMAEFIADFSLNSNKWINGKVIPVSISTP